MSFGTRPPRFLGSDLNRHSLASIKVEASRRAALTVRPISRGQHELPCGVSALTVFLGGRVSLPQHPLSAAFPSMSPQELSDLTDDIAQHGLRTPVVTYQGAVLDGWHRYTACLHASVDPRLTEFNGEDPASFVLSLNMHRRNLTTTQRAAAVVSVSSWKPSGNQPKGEPGSPPLSNAQMAVLADTTERTIQQTKRGVEAGLGKAMRDGKISAKAAAEKASAKKPAPPPEPDATHEAAPPDDDRMADIADDYEAALRIIEADDKLAEAWQCVKDLRAKYDELERLYTAQRQQLSDMTREAKRWQRKAESK
jgi:hypothetical protein